MKKPKLSEKETRDLVELYQKNDIKMSELCKIFKVSDDTIVRTIKKKGVSVRKTTGFCDEKNSNWKGGFSLHYAKNIAIRYFEKNECVVCGYKNSTDVHHLDKNKRNNHPENLVLLCPNHHREILVEIIKIEEVVNVVKNRGVDQ